MSERTRYDRFPDPEFRTDPSDRRYLIWVLVIDGLLALGMISWAVLR